MFTLNGVWHGLNGICCCSFESGDDGDRVNGGDDVVDDDIRSIVIISI